jgi:hypothetical protein
MDAHWRTIDASHARMPVRDVPNMPATVKYEVVELRVENSAGVKATFVKSTPIVTESELEGGSTTFRRLASIKTALGRSVNVCGEGLFETMDGMRWTLIQHE